MNFAGAFFASKTSNDAPVSDRSRTVQAILSPPYPIQAGLLTRYRGAARPSAIGYLLGKKTKVPFMDRPEATDFFYLSPHPPSLFELRRTSAGRGNFRSSHPAIEPQFAARFSAARSDSAKIV